MNAARPSPAPLAAADRDEREELIADLAACSPVYVHEGRTVCALCDATALEGAEPRHDAECLISRARRLTESAQDAFAALDRLGG